jgi:ABC-type uncharacterized transport system YnjBCD ATPase subunit
VVTTGGPVHLSSTARQRIAALRREVAATANSGLAFGELEARLDALYEEFRSVVEEEMRRAGRPFEDSSGKRVSAMG